MGAVTRTEVLIVGAGPTGLVLALCLTRLGVQVRLIDSYEAPGRTSRALAVHARTLEFYAMLGIDRAVLARGLKFDAINMWVRGRHVASAQLRDIGEGLSPFPYVLTLPQDVHESVLIEQLAGLGIAVEKQTTLIGLEQTADGVQAQVRSSDGATQTIDSRYLAGCDGAHSTVRRLLGMTFPGGTYQERFYVADIEGLGRLLDDQLHVCLDDSAFTLVFPLEGKGHGRLVGIVPHALAAKEQPDWDDIAPDLARQIPVTVSGVNWFSTYHVHHRVADAFRRGRVFLLGDAAHIHSPAGGQGMNTGIGDAINLGWKLAQALAPACPAPWRDRLLDSYEIERRAFAARLVATTDQAFRVAVDPAWFTRMLRLYLAPRVFAFATRFAAVRRLMFRTVSQTTLHYRMSPLSHGSVGSLQGGDRLPWLPTARAAHGMPPGAADHESNYEHLTRWCWQVQVHGKTSEALRNFCLQSGLPLTAYEWSEAAAKVGLPRDGALLLRPDGHLALVAPDQDPRRLQSCLPTEGNLSELCAARPIVASP